MKRKSIHNVNRPLVHVIIGWILGIVGGTIFLQQKYSSLFFIAILSLIFFIGYGFYFGLKNTFRIGVCVLISTGLFLGYPLHLESNQIQMNTSYELEGIVEKVKETDYYQWITIHSVRYKEVDTKHEVKSKVQLRMDKEGVITPNDYLRVKAERLADEPQMNPSDFDYAMYLKAQNVGATFKVTELIAYKEKETLDERLKNFFNTQLEALYSTKKVGIMEAALLGDDALLDQQTESLYNASGIGHVLCISGFHVSVIVGLLTFLLCLFPLPYNIRHCFIIGGIWAYAFISGNGTSTIRASIMVNVLHFGRCLWKEEDGLTSLSIAALFILMISPYQLFQVGFQLSFIAVFAILICLNEMEKRERMGEWCYPKWQKSIFMWLSIQLLTWPILAYHFFEIPFLISLINLIIIPIFSWIIIGGWFSLLLYTCHFPVAQPIAKCIELVLDGIEYVTGLLMKVPFATLCTGRPSMIMFILYGGIVILIGAVLFEYIKKNRFIKGVALLGCCYQLITFFDTSSLKVTLLYVGQGDSTVIETPKNQMLVIDGGNFGKGQVIEKYIKYRGKRYVEALFVSHSDADHIGGLIELLSSNIEVNKVFISATDDSELLQKFLSICQDKEIPVYRMSQQDTLVIEGVSITCLAPIAQMEYGDSNNNSLVCELKYGKFSALFTGDKEKISDTMIYDEIGPISLLKVSHHGSRTGTSKELLLKLDPIYAMISCGRKNLYGHPHGEVMELLEEADTKISRTDINGAICYETDGYYLKETKYREDA